MDARTILILLVLGIAALLINGCINIEKNEKNKNMNNIENNIENNNMNYSIKTAFVTITEVEKQRTHKFNYYSKEGEIMLSGNFSINNKTYPGKIIYDANRTLLFRPDPNQAVVFPKNHITYGFLPPEFISKDKKEDSADITILENSTVLRYKIKTPEAESVVEISNMKEGSSDISDINFTLPENTEYIKSEELVINVW